MVRPDPQWLKVSGRFPSLHQRFKRKVRDTTVQPRSEHHPAKRVSDDQQGRQRRGQAMCLIHGLEECHWEEVKLSLIHI